MKDRLKLDISPEKSKIINLRKKESDFLGYRIKAEIKGRKRVAYTHISAKKKEQYKDEGRKRIKQLQKYPTAKNALLYNSWVLGIHNYSRGATHVNLDFKKIHYQLRKTLYNRLRNIGLYERPKEPPPNYKKFYKNNYKTYKICGIILYPLQDISHSSIMNFSQWQTPYTKMGREHIHTKLKGSVSNEVAKLMKSNISNRNVEYFDNRISRYSMKNGKCEITGEFLPAEFVHCHHHVPVSLGGTDEFSNLRILNKFVHILIHATETQTINKYLDILQLSHVAIKKVNSYRKKCHLESIS